MTDDRSGVLQSPAYLAMTPVGVKQPLKSRLIEDNINRSGGSAARFRAVLSAGAKGRLALASNNANVSASSASASACAAPTLSRCWMIGARLMRTRRRGGCSWQSCRSRRDRHARCTEAPEASQATEAGGGRAACTATSGDVAAIVVHG